MPARPFPQSPAFNEVITGLLRMHHVAARHVEESQDADAVRESMTEPWSSLTTVERARIEGLSNDLYSISDLSSDSAPEPMNPQAQRKINEAYEARERGAWDNALELLRRWGKYIPAALLAYLRARIWDDGGYDQIAVLFFEQACRLDPDNEAFRVMHLATLKSTDLGRAKVISEAVLSASANHTPALVVQAADVLFGANAEMLESEAGPNYRRLIEILKPLLSRVNVSTGDDDWQVSNILFLIAASYRWLGQTREAFDYYSRALTLDPWNEGLLISRGILAYGIYQTSNGDLEKAAKLNTQSVWPYYFLAHHLLKNNRMEECRVMCERGLGKTAPPRAQSELSEFLAISMANQGFPSLIVRQAFENAIQTDPTNSRAVDNLERYLTAAANENSVEIDWIRPSDSDIRFAGQQQLRSIQSLAASGHVASA